ncbi:hypothetical protein WA026_018154 [Henosepilachna vigintioctopunctata]|uniref:Nuclear nucleic acid-binding protein C1D n=1 Tax=Henosepilachna vigintioctopunctata TaxID=420089 RepID=A0AAW1UN68_9CUCU
MSVEMNSKDFEKDPVIKDKLDKFHNAVDSIDEILQIAFNENMTKEYEKLPPKEKADFDLFTGFALNTLYWLYLRTRGEDPNTNDVKKQLTRTKEYMVEVKKAHERTTIRPKINVPVAERFIRHGTQIYDSSEERPNKKIKFDD